MTGSDLGEGGGRRDVEPLLSSDGGGGEGVVGEHLPRRFVRGIPCRVWVNVELLHPRVVGPLREQVEASLNGCSGCP